MTTATLDPTDVVIPTLDGLRLHATRWPHPSPRGSLVIVHGLGEHGGAYAETAAAIRDANGIEVIAPDLRGHGKSPGRRGYVAKYDQLVHDASEALGWAKQQHPGLPLFLLGHSNGGQVALRLALDPAVGPTLAGLIVSNPALQVATHVPALKLALGRLLLRFAPRVTMGVPLGTSELTRDESLWEARRADRLRHSRISAPLYFGMIDGGPLLKTSVQELKTPVLFLIGGSDPVIDPEFNLEVFQAVGSTDKTLKLYPEMVHEPLNDIGRETGLRDLLNWLENHLPILDRGRDS